MKSYMKPAQAQARSTQIKEADILHSLGSGVAVISDTHDLAYCNDTFAHWFDVPRELFVGHPISEMVEAVKSRFLPPDAAHECFRLENSDAAVSREYTVRFSDEARTLRQDTTAWRDEAGKLRGHVFAFHDITHEKAIDRMKTEFIAVASHELRTPMTSIKGAIDLVLSGFAGQIGTETQELLEIAHKSCDRLIRLINDILDLAKIEARQIKLTKVLLDLKDPVERSIRGVKSYGDQVGVKISMVAPDDLPHVEVDKDRIEQVVTNLLSNAIKFSPEAGVIEVRLQREDDAIVCRVIDHGCGIAEPDIEKVFGKFQQVGNSARKGGTGLGLAIAQALVQEHGGRIWVESKVDEGSQFIFRLPLPGA
jgi:signal transduction histidine kinase